MRSLLRLSFASLAALLIASCSQTGTGAGAADSLPADFRACTTLGCQNGLHLTWAQGAWKPGLYTVEVSLDGANVTCTGRLPLPACDAGPGFRCGPGASVRLGESGCALPPETHGLAGIDIDTTPAHVRIAVRRDGVEIGTQELNPSYREVHPNGPDCEPVCRQAVDVPLLPR